MNTTWVNRLSRLEPEAPARPLTDRALRRAVMQEIAAAAEFYNVDAGDLEALAEQAARHAVSAHRGAKAAVILLQVQDRLDREYDLG